MKLNQALRAKNRLAMEIARVKEQIAAQNSRPVEQPFDYDTRELLAQLRQKMDQLAALKGAIGKANGEVYPEIFRLAELKGAIALLKSLPTKHGKFLESQGYSQPKEVEYQAQIRQADADKLVRELEAEISRLQDRLDEFNQRCRLAFELD